MRCRQAGAGRFACLKALWRRDSEITALFLRELKLALIWGLLAFILLYFLPEFSPARDKQEKALDWTMRMAADPSAPAAGARYVFIDIDEKAFSSWKRPFMMPRDRLLELIDFAVRGGAAVVIVDVDLSDPLPVGGDPYAHPGGEALHPHDKALLEFFAAHEQRCAGAPDGGACGQVLLVRRLAMAPDLEPPPSSDSPASDGEARACGLLARSFLDGAMRAPGDPVREANRPMREARQPAPEATHLHWVSANFVIDEDGSVRRWRLWQAACLPSGRGAVLPAAQLAAAAVLAGSGVRSGAEALRQLREQLSRAVGVCCQGRCGVQLIERHIELKTAEKPIVLDLQPSALGQRILYELPHHFPGPTLLEEYAASSLLAALASRRPPEIRFDGAAVIIGASHPEAHDRFETPLHELPGPVIILNALNSLLRYGEIKPMHWAPALAIEALLIALVVATRIGVRGCASDVIVFFGIVLIMVPASLFFLKSAIWLDFITPLVVVEFLELCRSPGHGEQAV